METREAPIFPLDVELIDEVLGWTRRRIIDGSNPQHGARSAAELDLIMGNTISEDGMGGKSAMQLYTNCILPATRALNNANNLAFVSSAPTYASLAFDAALGASAIFAGYWEAGAGAIHAENQVLAWLAESAGFPQTAGGVFVAGGTMGNLAALHAARHARHEQLGKRPERWAILCSRESHSSIRAAAKILDVDLVAVQTDKQGRMLAEDALMAMDHPQRFFAIACNAGATNCGAIDDLEGLAELSARLGLWLHVDGAYGLGALASPEVRDQFKGLERADSFITDPHKWLFTPYDCCALMYRNPMLAARAHSQNAEYLDAIDKNGWNPSDFAIHMTRRARGLPLWFSLATYGTSHYARAINACLKTASLLGEMIKNTEGFELLLGPQLSVLLFHVPGMSEKAMGEWAETHRRAGTLLCVPTKWQNQPVFRLCLVHPETDPNYVMSMLKTMLNWRR